MPASTMTFEETLQSLLGKVGRRIEIAMVDLTRGPRLIASLTGRLDAGHSISNQESPPAEVVFLWLQAGPETTTITLRRDDFGGATRHDDGALALDLGGVQLMIAAPQE